MSTVRTKIMELQNESGKIRVEWNNEKGTWDYGGVIKMATVQGSCPERWAMTRVCQFLWSILEKVE